MNLCTPAPINWKINFKSSEEILRSCGMDLDSEHGKYPLKRCHWFQMIRDAMPKVQEESSTVIEQPDYSLFAEHRRICRELVQDEGTTKMSSLLKQLDSLIEEAKKDPNLSYHSLPGETSDNSSKLHSSEEPDEN